MRARARQGRGRLLASSARYFLVVVVVVDYSTRHASPMGDGYFGAV